MLDKVMREMPLASMRETQPVTLRTTLWFGINKWYL